MIHRVDIDAVNRPAVVERILRVARHRGFLLQQMSLTTYADEEKCRVSVTVKSERAIQQLLAQLARLVDVLSVELACDESNRLKISA